MAEVEEYRRKCRKPTRMGLDGFGWVWIGLDGFLMGLDGFSWVWMGCDGSDNFFQFYRGKKTYFGDFLKAHDVHFVVFCILEYQKRNNSHQFFFQTQKNLKCKSFIVVDIAV